MAHPKGNRRNIEIAAVESRKNSADGTLHQNAYRVLGKPYLVSIKTRRQICLAFEMPLAGRRICIPALA
jgi:hypothetical protein